MKRSLPLFATAILALAWTTLAQAETTIRITGSTAYRGPTHTAISRLFDGGTFTLGYVGTSFTGAAAANFRGKIGGEDVLIKTSWSGSEAGMQTVSFGAEPLTVRFLPTPTVGDTNAELPGGVGGTGGKNGLSNPQSGSNANSPEVPDIAMSDTFQASSAYQGLYKGKTYPGLQESINSPVGVVPFKFVASKSVPTSVTNITTQLAQNLYTSGYVRLSLFTGVDTDASYVFATGRDPDSGTRLTTLAEIGLGAASEVKQYQPTNANDTPVATANGAVAKNIVWPASTINTIPVAPFNGGYSSGGNLALAMGNDTTSMTTYQANGTTVFATGGFFISYMSTGDATTAINNGAKELQYNGVPFSNDNLFNGKYTFWGYEHVYFRPAAVGTLVQTVADALANTLKTTDATVKLNQMKVSRATDGAKVQ